MTKHTKLRDFAQTAGRAICGVPLIAVFLAGLAGSLFFNVAFATRMGKLFEAHDTETWLVAGGWILIALMADGGKTVAALRLWTAVRRADVAAIVVSSIVLSVCGGYSFISAMSYRLENRQEKIEARDRTNGVRELAQSRYYEAKATESRTSYARNVDVVQADMAAKKAAKNSRWRQTQGCTPAETTINKSKAWCRAWRKLEKEMRDRGEWEKAHAQNVAAQQTMGANPEVEADPLGKSIASFLALYGYTVTPEQAGEALVFMIVVALEIAAILMGPLLFPGTDKPARRKSMLARWRRRRTSHNNWHSAGKTDTADTKPTPPTRKSRVVAQLKADAAAYQSGQLADQLRRAFAGEPVEGVRQLKDGSLRASQRKLALVLGLSRRAIAAELAILDEAGVYQISVTQGGPTYIQPVTVTA